MGPRGLSGCLGAWGEAVCDAAGHTHLTPLVPELAGSNWTDTLDTYGATVRHLYTPLSFQKAALPAEATAAPAPPDISAL